MLYLVRIYNDYHNPSWKWFFDKIKAVACYNAEVKILNDYDVALYTWGSEQGLKRERIKCQEFI
jgi:hypothetical protein